MSAKTPIGSNLKLFRAKKKLLKDFITNDPYLSGELGNYKHGTLFRHDIVFVIRGCMQVSGGWGWG